MTFAQGQNRLTTHFSERIHVVKRRISVFITSLCSLLVSELSHNCSGIMLAAIRATRTIKLTETADCRLTALS